MLVLLQKLEKYKRLSFYVMFSAYLLAGINHFRDPNFYIPLLPDYFTYPYFINALAGSIEILLALSLLSKSLREIAAYGIIAMLIAFVPSHIHFITSEGCFDGSLCVPEWVAWVRLIVIHPLLMIWAFWHRN